MTPQELKPWSWAYYTARTMGEGRLLRAWLDLPEDYPIPLSVSHGMDFGHSYYPQDVKAPEPIHWAYNETMFDLARSYKPAIRLPHPFLLRTSGMSLPAGKGTLLIGPPPGPVNDRRLFDLIKDGAGGGTTILVKARGAYRQSLEFWRDRGFEAVTLGGVPAADFYASLATMLARHERIVGVTFSSALIFAAAVDRRVECVSGFAHRSLEPRTYLNEVNFSSPVARRVVGTFLAGNQAAIRLAALEQLGADYLGDRTNKREELERLINTLQRPIWLDPGVAIPSVGIRLRLARLLRKPGLINAGIVNYMSRLRREELSVMEIDELDIWRNGLSDRNFQLTPVSGTGNRRGGDAAEGYER